MALMVHTTAPAPPEAPLHPARRPCSCAWSPSTTTWRPRCRAWTCASRSWTAWRCSRSRWCGSLARRPPASAPVCTSTRCAAAVGSCAALLSSTSTTPLLILTRVRVERTRRPSLTFTCRTTQTCPRTPWKVRRDVLGTARSSCRRATHSAHGGHALVRSNHVAAAPGAGPRDHHAAQPGAADAAAAAAAVAGGRRRGGRRRGRRRWCHRRRRPSEAAGGAQPPAGAGPPVLRLPPLGAALHQGRAVSARPHTARWSQLRVCARSAPTCVRYLHDGAQQGCKDQQRGPFGASPAQEHTSDVMLPCLSEREDADRQDRGSWVSAFAQLWTRAAGTTPRTCRARRSCWRAASSRAGACSRTSRTSPSCSRSRCSPAGADAHSYSARHIGATRERPTACLSLSSAWPRAPATCRSTSTFWAWDTSSWAACCSATRCRPGRPRRAPAGTSTPPRAAAAPRAPRTRSSSPTRRRGATATTTGPSTAQMDGGGRGGRGRAATGPRGGTPAAKGVAAVAAAGGRRSRAC